VHTISLEGQFRCGASAAYEEWVLQLLALDGGGPQPWKGDDRFEVLVADSPMEMEAILRLDRSVRLCLHGSGFDTTCRALRQTSAKLCPTSTYPKLVTKEAHGGRSRIVVI
jgi:hypothetical protein